jgi:hypothetical protein
VWPADAGRLHPRRHQGPGESGDLVQLVPVLRERPAQRLVEAEKRGGLLLGVWAEPFRR